MPGMPEVFIRSAARPSSLATALSTALSGSGIAGTSGGGSSDSDRAADGDAGSVAVRHRTRYQQQRDRGDGDGESGHDCHHWVSAGCRDDPGSTRPPGRGTATVTPAGPAAASSRSMGSRPRMRREPERGPVDRHEHALTRVGDVAVRTHRFLGVHVDVRPARMVSPDRHQCEVEGAPVSADVGEAAV